MPYIKSAAKQKQWNDVYHKFQGNRQSVWREEATPFFMNKIEYLKHKKVKSILDAGCGDGRNLVALAVEGFKMTGVDISDIALEKCRRILGRDKNVTLRQGLLEDLNLRAASFDAIICDFVLVHVEDVAKVMANFHRVLKKGGYALLEFISTKDQRCNHGQKVGRNQYLQHGVFIRTFDLKDIERLLKKFRILAIDAEYYTDPDHGSGYHRKQRHIHHSYFVFAQKVK